jgi:HTH-type transcriptional regulator/antitoxin HipB
MIRSPHEIGQLIRSRREARSLTQAGLASSIGVSRKWIVEAESGKPTAEIGLIMRTLSILGVALTVDDESRPQPAAGHHDDIPDVNDVLAASKKPR